MLNQLHFRRIEAKVLALAVGILSIYSSKLYADSEDVFRAMTLNVRIDKPTEYGLPGFDARRSKIEKVIRYYHPDVIALQEVEDKFWDKIKSDFSDYHSTFWRRGGAIGTPNHKEGVAILAKKSRFYYFLENTEKTVTRKQRAEKGGCAGDYSDKDRAYRNVVRVKLKDKVNNRILDVFNTHFPSKDGCERIGMAEIVGNYVEKFGANIIVMGDLNAGFREDGSKHTSYKQLISSANQAPLRNTFEQQHKPMTASDSFITNHADRPHERTGKMIDHILVGEAFIIHRANVDRTLFLGGVRVKCNDVNSIYYGDTRYFCKYNYQDWSISEFDSYSDHWAVWADLERIDM